MKDPVSGVFRVSDWYDAHPNGSPSAIRLTGVIIADALAPTPTEAPADHHGKWVGNNELPVTVDRTDPSNFRIEWDQVLKQDWRATAQQRALDESTRLVGGPPGPNDHPATTRIGFRNPARRAGIATIGTTLPLLIDPNDPSRLSIDVGRMNLP
jgi:hypothetical protein